MKNDNLIIRIDKFSKIKFKEICESQGVTSSIMLRKFILRYINDSEQLELLEERPKIWELL